MGKTWIFRIIASLFLSFQALAGTTLVEESNGICQIKLKPEIGPVRPLSLLDLARYSRAHSRNSSIQSHILKGLGYRPDLVDGTNSAAFAFRKEKLCLLYKMAIDEIVEGRPNPNNVAGDCTAIRSLSREINIRAFDITTSAGAPVNESSSR